MCRHHCCCETDGHHHRHKHERVHHGFPWLIMDVEEEIRMLEEYREALTKRLEKVNKRLEALKR